MLLAIHMHLQLVGMPLGLYLATMQYYLQVDIRHSYLLEDTLVPMEVGMDLLVLQ